MHADPDFDAWSDYRLDTPREIAALLRQILANRQLVRVQGAHPADSWMSTLVEVDTAHGLLLLDRPAEPALAERMLGASGLLCETTLDQIRILFRLVRLQPATHDGVAVLAAPLPSSLVRLQRRDHFRVATPLVNPVCAQVALPPLLGGGRFAFALGDISCGGLALVDRRLVLGDTPGLVLTGCRLDLPESEPLELSLQVRNCMETLIGARVARRIGCMFVDLPRNGLHTVQRYITRLERDRIARLRGRS